jgi:protein arginine kinase
MELQPRMHSKSQKAPFGDVVLSCRVRLARNVAGFPFANRATETQCQELLNLTRPVLLQSEVSEGMIWVDLNKSTPRDRRLLFERHLISRNLSESELRRAVAVSGDESLSIMVNEEDHLRMQVLAPGFQLKKIFDRINSVDDAIESRLSYSFSPRWGYLTACPTNVGTGIRFSVMMHLPAMKMTNEIERVRRAARDLHLAVRGYHGEGSESAGDFYQISNQVTLGRSEQEILDEFETLIVPRIIEYEQQSRVALLERNGTLLDDRIFRALGVLRNSRLLGTEEAMKLLSRVRLGAHMGRIPGLEVETVNELFLLVQPAHLKLNAGGELTSEQLREARAQLVRSRLGC